MIRLTYAAAAALLWWLPSAAAQTVPATAGPVPAALIEELVLANRILNDRGVLDAYGHVSIRHPADPKRYLMARAVAPGLVSADDIMEFDLDSHPVERRDRSMFVERFIHGEAYKSRPDVNAVIHTIPRRDPLQHDADTVRPVFHNASFLHVGVPVWESATPAAPPTCWCATASLGGLSPPRLATSRSLDARPRQCRGRAECPGSTARAIFTDENARMQAVALSLGGPVNDISPGEGALRDRIPATRLAPRTCGRPTC